MKPFKDWTDADVTLHNSRVNKENRIPVPETGCERESDLHDQILAECKRRGWIAFHSRMDRKTTSNIGMPDFIILGVWSGSEGTNSGHVWMIECKRKGGKLTPQQFGLQQWAANLGHTISVVRTFQEFLNLLCQQN